MTLKEKEKSIIDFIDKKEEKISTRSEINRFLYANGVAFRPSDISAPLTNLLLKRVIKEISPNNFKLTI